MWRVEAPVISETIGEIAESCYSLAKIRKAGAGSWRK
jgi:hypothetical protein